MLILGLAVRFIHFALFEGTLLSPQYYAVDTIVCLVFGFLGYRATRVGQMTTQYGWINERAGLLRWSRRSGRNAGKRPRFRVTFPQFGASIGAEASRWHQAGWPRPFS